MKTCIRALVGLFVLLITSNTIWAQGNNSKNSAFLFAYYPKKGKENLFNDGYKQHLEWHRNQKDPLVWYAWYVITGDRVGMFIDGTFGLSFEDFDNRVAPAEDIADFQQTTAPFADIAFRSVFVLKSELSTTTLLEQRKPSSNIEAFFYSIIPGREYDFEEVVKKLVTELKKAETIPQFTFYKQITGGRLPSYMLMIPYEGFSYFDSDSAVISITDLITQTFPKEKALTLVDMLGKSVSNIQGETWMFRRDLSYFPND